MKSAELATEIPMKKRAGRPKGTERDDVVIKVDRSVVAHARYVAEKRGISLAEYVSNALRPIAARDFEKVVKEGGVS